FNRLARQDRIFHQVERGAARILNPRSGPFEFGHTHSKFRVGMAQLLFVFGDWLRRGGHFFGAHLARGEPRFVVPLPRSRRPRLRTGAVSRGCSTVNRAVLLRHAVSSPSSNSSRYRAASPCRRHSSLTSFFNSIMRVSRPTAALLNLA